MLQTEGTAAVRESGSDGFGETGGAQIMQNLKAKNTILYFEFSLQPLLFKLLSTIVSLIRSKYLWGIELIRSWNSKLGVRPVTAKAAGIFHWRGGVGGSIWKHYLGRKDGIPMWIYCPMCHFWCLCPFAFPFDQKLVSIFYMQNALKDSKKSETYPCSPGACDSVEELALWITPQSHRLMQRNGQPLKDHLIHSPGSESSIVLVF